MTFTSVVLAQLEPAFYGVYNDSLKKSRFSIYMLDEVAQDCFLYDFQRLDDSAKVIYSVTGYGHCDGPNGHMQLFPADSSDTDTLEVSFSSKDGISLLTVYISADSMEIYRSELYELEVEMEDEFLNFKEFFYSSDEGAEVYVSEEKYAKLITIYGVMKNGCTQNEFSGRFIADSTNAKLYRCIVSDGCKLEILFKEDYIVVTEFNCEIYHTPGSGCESWQGKYFIND